MKRFQDILKNKKAISMNPAREKYLRIVRAALWDTACTDEVTEDVLEIAKQQSTLGSVCCFSDDPGCRQELVRLICDHERTNAVLAEVIELLRSEGVECVLLKGQGCAAYYSQPMLRECGDIDLYVGEDNYERAGKILLQKLNRGSCASVNEQFSIKYRNVPIELHIGCNVLAGLRYDYRKYEKDAVENPVPVKVGEYTVNTLADEFNVLFIFVHFFKHFLFTGIGMRQICDWTMLLHRKYGLLDVELLGQWLKTLGLMEDWKVFGCMVVNYLGLPAEEMPFYDDSCKRQAGKVLDRIFETGNFGTNISDENNTSGNVFLGKLTLLKTVTKNFFAVVRIFPGRSIRNYHLLVRYGIGQIVRRIL